MSESGFVRVCTLDEIRAQRILERPVDAQRKALLLWVQGEVRAFQAACPHQEVALCEGIFDGAVLTCHEHLWQFDANTGKGIDPQDARLGCFDVRIRENEVWVSHDLVSQGCAGASGEADA